MQPTMAIVPSKIRTEQAGNRRHGIGGLRPRMVLYNEGNPDDEAIGSMVTAELRARPDAASVVGAKWNSWREKDCQRNVSYGQRN